MKTEPPPNSLGGKTLIVDANDGDSYPRPSAALLDAGEHGQAFVRPGIYENKIFITRRPIHLVGVGRDEVQIISRRGGPLSPAGPKRSHPRHHVSIRRKRPEFCDKPARFLLCCDKCRAAESILSGVVIYGPQSRPTFIKNEVCGNRESGILCLPEHSRGSPTMSAGVTTILVLRCGILAAIRSW